MAATKLERLLARGVSLQKEVEVNHTEIEAEIARLMRGSPDERATAQQALSLWRASLEKLDAEFSDQQTAIRAERERVESWMVGG